MAFNAELFLDISCTLPSTDSVSNSRVPHLSRIFCDFLVMSNAIEREWMCAFLAIDRDRNGYLSEDEVFLAIASLGYDAKKAHAKAKVSSFDSKLS